MFFLKMGTLYPKSFISFLTRFEFLSEKKYVLQLHVGERNPLLETIGWSGRTPGIFIVRVLLACRVYTDIKTQLVDWL